MNELLLTTLWLVACVLWYIAGRDHGRRKALKDVDPYVQFAKPIFHDLHAENTEQVVVLIARSGDGEWTATSAVTRG